MLPSINGPRQESYNSISVGCSTVLNDGLACLAAAIGIELDNIIRKKPEVSTQWSVLGTVPIQRPLKWISVLAICSFPPTIAAPLPACPRGCDALRIAGSVAFCRAAENLADAALSKRLRQLT